MNVNVNVNLNFVDSGGSGVSTSLTFKFCAFGTMSQNGKRLSV